MMELRTFARAAGNVKVLAARSEHLQARWRRWLGSGAEM
jgi:hypothetical protein